MEGMEKLEDVPDGDWIDLRCAEKTIIKAGDFGVLPLGVAIKLPTCHEAIIAPRASLFKKHGIFQTNGIGIIDSSYCGENDWWGFPYYATRNTVIDKNERICQFRLFRNQTAACFQTVDIFKRKGG